MPFKNKARRILSGQPVQVLARLFLGGIFLYASLDKIAHPQAFAGIVANYGILPAALVTLPALALPWLEFLAGLCLLAGFWRRSAAGLLSLLLLAFIVALAINAFRGINLGCGCFSTSASDTENAYLLIFRDLLFLIPGLLIVFYDREEENRRGDRPGEA